MSETSTLKPRSNAFVVSPYLKSTPNLLESLSFCVVALNRAVQTHVQRGISDVVVAKKHPIRVTRHHAFEPITQSVLAVHFIADSAQAISSTSYQDKAWSRNGSCIEPLPADKFQLIVGRLCCLGHFGSLR